MLQTYLTLRAQKTIIQKRQAIVYFSIWCLFLALCCSSCGLLLDEPNPYPDMDVGGEEESATMTENQVNMNPAEEPSANIEE